MADKRTFEQRRQEMLKGSAYSDNGIAVRKRMEQAIMDAARKARDLMSNQTNQANPGKKR